MSHRPQDAATATAYPKSHVDLTIAMLARRFAIALANMREMFVERASILEYEAGLTRLRAESRAFVEIAMKLQRLKDSAQPQLGLAIGRA